MFREPCERKAYVELLRYSLVPGGLLLLLAGAPEPSGSEETQGWVSPDLSGMEGPWLADPVSSTSFAPHDQAATKNLGAGEGGQSKLGPPQVPRCELLAAFKPDEWGLLCLQFTRFDPTTHYMKELKQLPCAWCALLQRL